MAKNVSLTQVSVRRSDLLVDPAINSRQDLDETQIKRLADSIKTTGLLHPPVVVRLERDREDLGHEDAEELYMLVAGFRRQAALDMLGVEEADYSLAPSSWGMAEILAANLTENLGREDLSTYEIAQQCLRLANDHNMTGEAIAKAVKTNSGDPEDASAKPFSANHVNNLVRCARELDKRIVDAWKARHPAASLRTLIKLAAEKDKAAQYQAWLAIVNPEVTEAETGEEDDGETEEEKAKKKPGRPGVAALQLMITAIQESEKEHEWKAGAIAALSWAAGVNKTVGGIKVAKKDTGRGAKKDKSEDDED